jgi:hypothetical protein
MQSLAVAKYNHRLEIHFPTQAFAKREESCHQQVDRGMSSRKKLDRELSWVRREAILRLCRHEEMGDKEIDMLTQGGYVEAVLESVNISGWFATREEPYQLAGNAVAGVLHHARICLPKRGCRRNESEWKKAIVLIQLLVVRLRVDIHTRRRESHQSPIRVKCELSFDGHVDNPCKFSVS